MINRRNWGIMNTLVLLAVLHAYVSIPPIRFFQPYPGVKCPSGYTIWWPQGKEFDSDRYAECIKPIRHQSNQRSRKGLTNAALRHKIQK